MTARTNNSILWIMTPELSAINIGCKNSGTTKLNFPKEKTIADGLNSKTNLL
jgi:hypothetical protein